MMKLIQKKMDGHYHNKIKSIGTPTNINPSFISFQFMIE
jgi:hypothetical protein